MTDPQPFVPADFDPPRQRVTDHFRLEPLGPRSLYQPKHLLCGLHAVYGFLHGRVKILYAKTQPVEPETGQRIQPRFVHGTWIDFNRVFTPRSERKAAPQHRQHLAQLVIR